MKIYKYPFVVTDQQILDLPKGVRPLAVALQFDIPCLWALVDENAPLQRRRLTIYGTGHSIDPSVNQFYVGTFQMRDGLLVWHVFINKDNK
jgi:hypothetical protein